MATHRMIGQCPYFVDSQHFLHWREFFPFHHFRRYKHIFYNALFYCSFKNIDCFFTFKLLNFKLKYVVLETEINPQMFPHSLQDPYSQYITFDFISRPFCPHFLSFGSILQQKKEMVCDFSQMSYYSQSCMFAQVVPSARNGPHCSVCLVTSCSCFHIFLKAD